MIEALAASIGHVSRPVLAASAAAAALLLVAFVAGADARPQTTTPGVIYVVKTVVTDKKIVIARDQFTRHGIHRLPRGAQIRYAITNKGTRPYSLKVWETTSDVMKPGGHTAIFVNWLFRGTYRFFLLHRGRPVGPKGIIVIF
jgi:hypothetical protein